MAINTIAFCVVVKEHPAAGRLAPVCALTAEPEHVFHDIRYFGRVQELGIAKVLGIFLGSILRVVGQHVYFGSAGVWMPGPDTVTHRPFDIGREFDDPARCEIIT